MIKYGQIKTFVYCSVCEDSLAIKLSYTEDNDSFNIGIEPCERCIQDSIDEATKEKENIIKEILKIKGE